MSATWERCRGDFEADGSLRDIYIHAATAEVWEAAFEILVGRGVARFTVDGHAGAVPRSAHEALSLRSAASPLLVVEWAGIEVACHFFADDEVELDFVPNDVTDPERFGSLLGLVRDLGLATDRDVVVTPENQPEHWLLRYDRRADSVARKPPAG